MERQLRRCYEWRRKSSDIPDNLGTKSTYKTCVYTTRYSPWLDKNVDVMFSVAI